MYKISLQEYWDMTPKERQAAMPAMIRDANRRIRLLRKKGIAYGAINIAEDFLSDFGGDYYNINQATDRELGNSLIRFLNAKTSLPSQAVKAENKIKRAFRKKGISFDNDKDYNNFFKAINATKDKHGKYLSSNQIIDIIDGIMQMEDEQNLSDILNSAEEYINANYR